MNATRPAVPTAYVAPRDEVEAGVARLWEEVLCVAPVGVDDDYFDLGGESLAAFAIITRIHARFGVTLTPRDFFDAGTVAAMAATIRSRAPAA
jgi:hypothetical protein